MKRWTKNAKNRLEITVENTMPEDNHAQYYRYLIHKMNHLAALVSMDPDAVKFVDGNVDSMIQQFSHCSIQGTPTPPAQRENDVPSSFKALGKTIKTQKIQGRQERE